VEACTPLGNEWLVSFNEWLTGFFWNDGLFLE
jgi:hypothetical protein